MVYTVIDGVLQRAARTEDSDVAIVRVLAVELRADGLSDQDSPGRALVS
jgi:hypothetical protein